MAVSSSTEKFLDSCAFILSHNTTGDRMKAMESFIVQFARNEPESASLAAQEIKADEAYAGGLVDLHRDTIRRITECISNHPTKSN